MSLCLLTVLSLAARPAPSPVPASIDAAVAKGIRLVDEGDYDAAIVVLDTAAARLVADKARARDLSQAYLYLGIAYVGKGHDAAAKARFREAVTQMKDLSLSAERYPPKVINLFEAAKDEVNHSRPASRASIAPGDKTGGGGSKKLLLIGGAVVVAGGGAALALRSGDSGGCDNFFADPMGLLNASQTSFGLTTRPTQAGPWQAELSWTIGVAAASARTSQPAAPTLFLFAVDAMTGVDVGESRLVTPTSSIVEWQGAAGQTFRVGMDLVDAGATTSSTYRLAVTGPCF